MVFLDKNIKKVGKAKVGAVSLRNVVVMATKSIKSKEPELPKKRKA